ncbi:MAG: hypothetical protein AB7U83_05145 [Vicinamibacterales bacterium]
MRTTLDIDDDVLQAAKELAQRDGRTAGQVVSDLARRGLRAPTAKSGRIRLRGGVPVLPSRGEIVTVEHVDRLRDDEGV